MTSRVQAVAQHLSEVGCEEERERSWGGGGGRCEGGTLSRLDSRWGLKMMGGGRGASCQVGIVLPKCQIPLKLQQTLLIVESHVVRSAGLPSQVKIQRSADLLYTHPDNSAHQA